MKVSVIVAMFVAVAVAHAQPQTLAWDESTLVTADAYDRESVGSATLRVTAGDRELALPADYACPGHEYSGIRITALRRTMVGGRSVIRLETQCGQSDPAADLESVNLEYIRTL